MDDCKNKTKLSPGTRRHPLGERVDPSTGRSTFFAITDLSEKNERGEDCKCRCPECETPFLARFKSGKPTKKEFTPCFAHKPGTRECDPDAAYETAIHKIAKQIIQDSAFGWVPEVVARCEGQTPRPLSPEKLIKLDATKVKLEKAAAKKIKPDISAPVADDHRNRTLYIEIYVTHKCDQAKIDHIQDNQLSTIEIDLSGLDRNMAISEVEAAIRQPVLQHADRKWLYNRHQVDEEKKMAAASKEKLRFAAKQLVTAYTRSPSLSTSKDLHALIIDAGLSRLLEAGIESGSCFDINDTSWQAFLLVEYVVNSGASSTRSFTPESWAGLLGDHGFTKPEFREALSPALIDVIREEVVDFAPPSAKTKQLVGRLQRAGALEYRSDYWTVRAEYIEAAQIRLAGARATRDRIRSLGGLFQQIETGSGMVIDMGLWMSSSLENYGLSPEQIATYGDAPYADLIRQMRRLLDMLLPGGGAQQDLLGLPLEAFRAVRQAEQAAALKEAARLTGRSLGKPISQPVRNSARRRRSTWLTKITDFCGRLLLLLR